MGLNCLNKSYIVYTHSRGDNNKVFYVESGAQGRQFQGKKSDRNEDWFKVNEEVGFFADVIDTFDTPKEAKNVEFELIDFIELNNLVNRTNCEGSVPGGSRDHGKHVIDRVTGIKYVSLRSACTETGENYSTNQNRMMRNSKTKRFDYA